MATVNDVTDDEREVERAPKRPAMTHLTSNHHVAGVSTDLCADAWRPVPRKHLPLVVAVLDVAAKLLLVAFILLSVADPSWGNLEGKAPLARAVTYPLFAFVVPVGWLLWRRHSTYPWFVDLMITATCFTDILGNRLDLYDSIVWVDDWMHFMNTGLLGAAVVALTLSRRVASVTEIVERAVVSGMTLALGWEVFEYISFMTKSAEMPTAYADTVVDLSLGWLGSVVAGLAISVAWSRRRGVVEAADGPQAVHV